MFPFEHNLFGCIKFFHSAHSALITFRASVLYYIARLDHELLVSLIDDDDFGRGELIAIRGISVRTRNLMQPKVNEIETTSI